MLLLNDHCIGLQPDRCSMCDAGLRIRIVGTSDSPIEKARKVNALA